MALDMWLTGNRYDDLVLWGGIVARDPVRQRELGLLGHFATGISLAALFSGVRPTLPRRPAWQQALGFVLVEHLTSFPLVGLGDRRHPAVLRGELPPLRTWTYFWVETWRHLAYGLALGAAAQLSDERRCG
jgi:hypothetical protein